MSVLQYSIYARDSLHGRLEFIVFMIITCICVGIRYGKTITTGAFTIIRYII